MEWYCEREAPDSYCFNLKTASFKQSNNLLSFSYRKATLEILFIGVIDSMEAIYVSRPNSCLYHICELTACCSQDFTLSIRACLAASATPLWQKLCHGTLKFLTNHELKTKNSENFVGKMTPQIVLAITRWEVKKHPFCGE